jgi:hypothetical protein
MFIEIQDIFLVDIRIAKVAYHQLLVQVATIVNRKNVLPVPHAEILSNMAKMGSKHCQEIEILKVQSNDSRNFQTKSNLFAPSTTKNMDRAQRPFGAKHAMNQYAIYARNLSDIATT